MEFLGLGAPELIALVLTLCVTNLVQGITGFGSIILALPALAFFFPLPELIPALVVVNIIQTVWFAVRDRAHLDRRAAGAMLALSLVGIPVGWWVFNALPSESLKLVLGFTVFAIALWNLTGPGERLVLPGRVYHLFNFIGGFAQGAFAAGGPFLVIYAARSLPDKTAFRATLSAVWVAHNLLLCVLYTARGNWSAPMIPVMVASLPVIVITTWAGTRLHDRIPQAPFRKMVFGVLLLSGIILIRPLFW